MNSMHSGLRREFRRAVRQGRALMAAVAGACLLLAITLALAAIAGWGTPSFSMSKLTRADMPAADAAAARPARVVASVRHPV